MTPHVIEQLFIKLTTNDVSRKQQRKIVTSLSAALGKAVKKGLLAKNVCEEVDRPKVNNSEPIKAYTPDQVKALLVSAATDRLYAMYVLAFDTGMRQEEVFALHWPDIDFVARTVRVEKALEEVSLNQRRAIGESKGSEGRFRLKEIKTAKGRRTLHASLKALEELRQHKERMDKEGHGSDLVFCDTKGGFLSKSNVRCRSFEPVLERAGLPNYGIHGLRHTCATFLLHSGLNIKVVSERLGHSSVVLTPQTYIHVMPGMQEEAAQAISSLFSKGESNGEPIGHS